VPSLDGATSLILRAAVALFLVTVWSCTRAEENPGPEYAAAAENAAAGFVAPLGDDTDDEIRSWVDGEVVTDWGMEIARRDRALEAYLNDADPERGCSRR
jgi:hypothetical protein